MRDKLAVQPPADRKAKSRRLEEKLFNLPVFSRALRVAFFASIEGAADTHPMIERALRDGKKVALPRVDKDRHELVFYAVKDLLKDTAPGVLGILEPRAGLPVVQPASLDCVVVPGLAFDRAGARFGRGAGFYDRFLSRLSPGTAKIGIGFSFQMIKHVPCEAHDEKLDLVLTD